MSRKNVFRWTFASNPVDAVDERVGSAPMNYRTSAAIRRSSLELSYYRSLSESRALLFAFCVCWYAAGLLFLSGIRFAALLFVLILLATSATFFVTRACFGRVSIVVTEQSLVIEEGWMSSPSGRTTRKRISCPTIRRLLAEKLPVRAANGSIEVHHLDALMFDGSRIRLVSHVCSRAHALRLKLCIEQYLAHTRCDDLF